MALVIQQSLMVLASVDATFFVILGQALADREWGIVD